MKSFFFLILLSSGAGAFTLEKFQSAPGGVDRQTFDFSGKITTYHRGTNLFDKDLSDRRIGTLVPENQKAIDSKRKPIQDVLTKVEAVDQFLKKEEGKSFNEVAGAPGHGTVFLLNGKIIPADSKYFAELDKIFTSLKDEKWKLVSGWELAPDLTSVNEYAKGKVTKKEFVKGMYCDRAARSCTYYGGGKVLFKDDIF